MAIKPDQGISGMEGDVALPRRNGELVFSAPWEGRAFGIAVALKDGGLYRWDGFRDRLITEIALAAKQPETSAYYEQWLAALEKLVIETGCLTTQELDRRIAEYATGQRTDANH